MRLTRQWEKMFTAVYEPMQNCETFANRTIHGENTGLSGRYKLRTVFATLRVQIQGKCSAELAMVGTQLVCLRSRRSDSTHSGESLGPSLARCEVVI